MFSTIVYNVVFNISHAKNMNDYERNLISYNCKNIEFVVWKLYVWQKNIQMFVQLFKRFEKSFVIFKFLVFQQIYIEIKRNIQTRYFCKNTKKYFVTIDFVNAIQ